MSYKSSRNHEIRSENIRIAEELVKEYDPNKKTIILLPGGLGSQLERTKKPYSQNNPGPFGKYDPVWIDFGIIFDKEALTLEINDKGHDQGNHIIIPNGPLRFFVKPYNETRKFFVDDFNYVVYGFDWRRPILESAMWLEDFLKRFRAGVIARFNNDKTKNPLSNTTLICHSQGGLVAAVFLQRVFSSGNITPKKVSEWIQNVITIGTPFYANANHIKRYYKGEKGLNFLYGSKKIAQIAGSSPGPYIFLFLDKDTFEKDKINLEIDRYPVREGNNNNLEVDPYAESTLRRYPNWIRAKFLNDAKKTRQLFTKKLPKNVADRVFHLRSGLLSTGVEWSWKNIDGSNFDPENDNFPITMKKGDGDGTVPAWAARLAQIPLDRVYDLKKAKKHMDLMEHEETLHVIRFIVNKKRLPETMSIKDKKFIGVKKASRATVDNFLLGVKNKSIKVEDDIVKDPSIWRGVMEDINLCY